MRIRLLFLQILLLFLFSTEADSQTPTWAISGSFNTITVDSAGNLYTLSINNNTMNLFRVLTRGLPVV